MSLLPTIGEHIIEGMDVEGLTNDLQEKSRASKLVRNSRPTSPESQPPQHTPTDTYARSDVESSIISIQEVGTTLGDSTQSWVDRFSLRSSGENSNGEAGPSDSLRASVVESITATSTSSQAESSTSAVRRYLERLTETLTVAQPTEKSTVQSKSKAELWREIKILSECPGFC